MKKQPRRNHPPAFKAKVALAALKGDQTLSQMAEHFKIHGSQITNWKDQLQQGAVGIFETGAASRSSAPEVDIKSLHAKIGELTLENDFLEGALRKAGFLSAKR